MMTQSTNTNIPIEVSADITAEDELWLQSGINYEDVINQCLRAAASLLQDHPLMDLKEPTISVLLTNDNHIQELNNEYREKNKPTNVLSFPSMDFNEEDDDASINIMDIMQQTELGDIILAYETIKSEAEEQKKPFDAHFKHLIVHGFLHLLGYDHIEEDQAEAMETLEAEILNKLGIENPYV